ncbi:hypothetical protein QBC47DRAFT_385401 [Echria macrotheca]|uniref:G domain-containing protein n=1 Tax=Echria macrotheca TaxID=438768 RepID=A0AAJ0B9L3_9PEZI|nr:hypothetical protein QBC47DRAFT_385401 [Echria macrotheca]
MDPLSITAACVGLLGAVGGTSAKIVAFIRSYRDAQADLACILEELSELQLVIELLRDDANVNNNQTLPEPLRNRVSTLLMNCLAILGNIDTVLNKYTGTAGPAKWVMFGKDDMVVLRTSLETHRGALSLMLDLLSISLSKRIQEDTAAVRGAVKTIKQDTSQLPEVMARLEKIQVMVARTDELSVSGHDYIRDYIDSLSSYAETICNDVEWSSDGGNHTPKPSPKPSPKSSSDSLQELESRTPQSGEAPLETSVQPDGSSNDSHRRVVDAEGQKALITAANSTGPPTPVVIIEPPNMSPKDSPVEKPSGPAKLQPSLAGSTPQAPVVSPARFRNTATEVTTGSLPGSPSLALKESGTGRVVAGESSQNLGPVTIALLGVTGAGKTTFAAHASGRTDLRIGHGIEACTCDVQMISFCFEGREIHLIDTPGFDHDILSNTEIVESIAIWMNERGFGTRPLLDGLVLFEPISLHRANGAERRRVRLLEMLFGVDVWKRVVIATTMWDAVKDTAFEMPESSVSVMWEHLCSRGAQVERHMNTSESAHRIISHVVQSADRGGRLELLLQTELRRAPERLSTMPAGKELRRQLEESVKELRETLVRHEHERPWDSGWYGDREAQERFEEWSLEKWMMEKRLETRRQQLKRLNGLSSRLRGLFGSLLSQ